jgi:hypothetical protein
MLRSTKMTISKGGKAVHERARETSRMSMTEMRMSVTMERPRGKMSA